MQIDPQFIAAFVALPLIFGAAAAADPDVPAPVSSEAAPDDMEAENGAVEAAPQSAFLVLPPIVEFLSMESDARIEAPKADELEIGGIIHAAFENALHGPDKTAHDGSAEFPSGGTWPAPDALYQIMRGKDQSDAAVEFRNALTAHNEDGYVLLVRTRFYLDYWARSGRGWQVATSILSADRSDKRMVMEARLYSGDSVSELWKHRVQERVTPRASEKGIERAIARTNLKAFTLSIDGGETDND